MAVLDLFAAFTNLRLTLVAILSFILVYTIILTFRRPSNIPPGPWCFPIVGYLPNIAISSRFYGLPLPAVLLRLSKKYGHVFSLYLGDQLCVVLNNHEAVKEAFMNPKLNDRPTAAHFQNNEATGVINASGASWKAQRAFTLGVFRRFGVGKSVFENQICSELEILFERFREKQGAGFDPSAMILTAIANITSRVTVAKRYDHGDEEFKDLQRVTERIVKLAGAAGFKNIIKVLRLLPSKANEILAKVKNEFMAIVNGSIGKRKSKFDSRTIGCLIDVYLKKCEDKDLNPHINDDTIGKTVASLFMAGTDTSAYQILWVLVYLLCHSDVLKKVQDEIDNTVGRDRLPTMDDQCDMPFTQAVINECMRLCAPVPMGVMHAASDDTTLFGYTIPKGTMFIANIWGAHNDPDTWPKPNLFDPGRFLDTEGQLTENEDLIPFSAGRRVCLGENLARMEIFLFTTHIVQKFDLSVPEGEPAPSLEGNFAFNYSTKPFTMTAKKRHID